MPHAPIRVLLVDDDEDDRILTRGLLASMNGPGYLVDEATSWDEGLARMEKGEHDVYLLDHRLGRRRGIELLVEGRARGCRGPAIILTGLADRELDMEAMSAGAADYLVKGRTDAVLLERSIRYAIERGRVLQALEHRSAELARSNAELEQFASIASHDLRSPLQVISGYVELLQIGYGPRLDARAVEIIGKALKGVERLDALITDLLAFARLEAESRPRGPVDLGTACDLAVTDLGPRIEAVGATVTRGPMPTVVANDVQIGQVFRNLIGNALKFRSEAPPKVTVTAEERGGDVIVHVRDNGPGIAPRHQERIFKMFQRLPGS